MASGHMANGEQLFWQVDPMDKVADDSWSGVFLK